MACHFARLLRRSLRKLLRLKRLHWPQKLLVWRKSRLTQLEHGKKLKRSQPEKLPRPPLLPRSCLCLSCRVQSVVCLRVKFAVVRAGHAAVVAVVAQDVKRAAEEAAAAQARKDSEELVAGR